MENNQKPNQKPEWFELADNDRPTKRNLKPTKSLLAITATLALTTLAGWGLMSNDESKAMASESISPVAAVPTTSVQSTSTPTPTARATKTRVMKAPTAIKPSSSSSTSKDLILPPTKKAGDDENDDN
jgi:hypothetical protein